MLSLAFLLLLSLLLAWLIGHLQLSPTLLVLLVLASLVLWKGRWEQVLTGTRLLVEMQERRRLRRQLQGESLEWLNFALKKWYDMIL